MVEDPKKNEEKEDELESLFSTERPNEKTQPKTLGNI